MADDELELFMVLMKMFFVRGKLLVFCGVWICSCLIGSFLFRQRSLLCGGYSLQVDRCSGG